MTKPNSPKLVFYGVKYFPSRGGTSRVAENLIRNLTDRYSISIYCFKNKKASDYIPAVRAIQFPELPFGSAGVFVYYFFTAMHLLLFINRNSIIHAHKTDCAFFLPLLRLKFPKIVATSHEAPYHRDKWSAIGKAYFHLMEWMFIHSGVILTSISKPLANYYTSKYNKTVYFLPNGIEVNQSPDLESAQEILDTQHIKGSYFMYSARRIMSTKGLHTMLEAVHQLKLNTPVVIAGDASHAKNYVGNLKKKYKHLNLHFAGYVDLPALLGLISKSELFIFPSEIEGMSIMLLEVVAVGTPIICSDIPENTQVFDDSEILYFKNKDAGDLAAKIEFAQANPEKMKTYIAKSQVKIKQKLNWKEISNGYTSLYHFNNEDIKQDVMQFSN